jgi:hypothetical protein
MLDRKSKTYYPYRIVVKGRLNKNWRDWFGGINLEVKGENSVITAHFPDQAALHGTLNKIRDLNLELLKVEKLSNSQNGMYLNTKNTERTKKKI